MLCLKYHPSISNVDMVDSIEFLMIFETEELKIGQINIVYGAISKALKFGVQIGLKK